MRSVQYQVQYRCVQSSIRSHYITKDKGRGDGVHNRFEVTSITFTHTPLDFPPEHKHVSKHIYIPYHRTTCGNQSQNETAWKAVTLPLSQSMGAAVSSPAEGDTAGGAGRRRQASLDQQQQQQQQQQQDSGGPWDVNLGIPFSAVNGVRSLADGTACTCFRGELGGGGSGNDGGSRPVAIKTLKAENDSKSDAEDLDRELSILQLLQHPNIVGLAGAGQMPEGRGLFIATELLSGRTLSAAIGTKDCPEGSSWLWRARVRSWFPMEEAFRQAAGVASALAYMHDDALPGAKILHRDIKSNNLAFTADFGTLKLFDFGLAKILRPGDLIGDNLYKMTGNTGSMRYMSPEVARNLPANETADVYSFAMVLWEMVSLHLPFQFYRVKEMMEQVVLGGVRPRLPPDWPEGFKDLLTRCWSPDMSKRPSMAEVETRLRELLQETNKQNSRHA
ncbi:unnamed protein product [Pylaiella littoralis]